MYTNEKRQTIYTDEEQAYTRLEHETEGSKSSSATTEADARSPLRRKRMLLASIALVIGIVPAWFVPNSVLYESTDDAQIDGHIMRLSTRINGQVEQVKAVEGQLVHAGDVLAVIEPTEYKIAVCRALARLADAENNAASLYLTAAITTTTAYGGLNSAQAAVKNAAGEKEAANNLLQADRAVLEQLSAQDGRRQ
jgi:membrane fusion protein (multidrug efflux system)